MVEQEVDVSSDESSEEEAQRGRSYKALMQGFTENDAREAKRRKLETPKAEQPALVEDDPPSDIDQVEEPEEEPTEGNEEDATDSDDEEVNSSDPFEAHFAPESDMISPLVRAVSDNQWALKRVASKDYRTVYAAPKPGAEDEVPLPPTISSAADVQLKKKLEEVAVKKIRSMDSTEQIVASSLFGYRDVLFCERTAKNAGALRQLACLHALNHVFK